MSVKIYQGNCLEVLRTLPKESIHCVVTSPPYWGLRSYGTNPRIWDGDPNCNHEWVGFKRKGMSGGPSEKQESNVGSWHKNHEQGFCEKCGAWRGEFGLEPTPELYVNHLVQIFSEIRRVLRKDGTAWLNLGDSYAGGGRNSGNSWEHTTDKQRSNKGSFTEPSSIPCGLKAKDLVGIPWRSAFALQADGWWLRSEIIWAKGVSGQKQTMDQITEAIDQCDLSDEQKNSVIENINLYVGNPMPESVTDRPARAHEHIFLLTKSKKYYYDNEAVKEEAVTGGKKVSLGEKSFSKRQESGMGVSFSGNAKKDTHTVLPKRNMRDVWAITTKGFKGAHFATFPLDLIEPCIKAGTSEKGCCPKCGAPMKRITKSKSKQKAKKWSGSDRKNGCPVGGGHVGRTGAWESETYGKIQWKLTCKCKGIKKTNPCVVYDPFGGSGTTAIVASGYNQDAILSEMNPEYVEMARKRILDETGIESKVIIHGKVAKERTAKNRE